MFTSLEITNFRAFQSLKIDGLRRVNIFGGKNSAGKTCILEACELLLAPEPLRSPESMTPGACCSIGLLPRAQ